MPSPRNVVILGSTGSIGTQTLDVIRRLGPEKMKVVGLSARRNADLLAQQASEFDVPYVVFGEGNAESVAGSRQQATEKAQHPPPLSHGGTQTIPSDSPSDSRPIPPTLAPHSLAGGPACAMGPCNTQNRIPDTCCLLPTLTDLVMLPEADTVVVAVAGAAVLEATLTAAQLGKRICLATKEVLVAAGDLVMSAARESGAEILPIDSEHSAIFQCVQGYKPEDIARIHLTASGGPFRTWTKEQIANATIEDALKHPTWRMGGKITIDSATLMNKGLEVIEACHLFGLPITAVNVVVHPQSVVHSFVETRDGSLLAQLGLPDMRLPIQIALLHPEKVDTGLPRLNPTEMTTLTFEEPDTERFPCLALARQAFQIGGTAPAVLNAANEAAVGAFLNGELRFGEIPHLVEAALNAHEPQAANRLEVIRAADTAARNFVAEATSR